MLAAGAASPPPPPPSVTVEPLSSFQTFGEETAFGPLAWRGGLVLASADPGFGGFSGIVLSADCETLTAVSDTGRWLTARLAFDGAKLSGFTALATESLRDSKGRPQRSKVWSDAEAVTEIAPGQLAVAYESRVRIGTYDLGAHGLAASFAFLPYPKDIDRGADNGEIEALGYVRAGPQAGKLLAIAERQADPAGNTLAWLWRGSDVTRFALAPLGDFVVTDLAILADGTVLTLERSFSVTALPGMAMRRFALRDVAPGAVIRPDLLFEGRVPFYAIDNMEGIAACRRDGEQRIMVMSDNNLNSTLQRNLLLQFAYRP